MSYLYLKNGSIDIFSNGSVVSEDKLWLLIVNTVI